MNHSIATSWSALSLAAALTAALAGSIPAPAFAARRASTATAQLDAR